MNGMMDQPANPSRPPLIMVVDDDLGIRFFLRFILERDGYQVVEAGDGLQALSVYASMQPDLVLLDAMMPLMDGFTACTRLRTMPEGNRTPIIIITALKNSEVRQRAFQAGATDYIFKPVEHGVLRQRVQHLLQARRIEQPMGEGNG